MIISGNDIGGIFAIKQSIGQHFEMKDLGRLNYLLGLNILSNFAGYYLFQIKYTSDILARVGFFIARLRQLNLKQILSSLL